MSGPKSTEAKLMNWQDPSKFRIFMTGAGADALELPDPELLTMACNGVEMASIATTPIEDYTAEEWRFASGRTEAYQIAITFKDFNNFELYRAWSTSIQKFQRWYPASQYFNLEIHTASDFSIEKFEKILEFKKCILTNVSGPTLSNDAVASVAEFSVQLKSSYVEIEGGSGFLKNMMGGLGVASAVKAVAGLF